MGFVDNVGLAMAEQLERSVGPFLALPAYKNLLVRAPEPVYGAKVALGVLRCAVKLGQAQEVEAIAEHWSALAGGGDHLATVIGHCRALVAGGHKWPAVTLARAEATREGKARAHYLLARCLELAGDGDGAFVAFGEAAHRADKEPNAADVALASRTKRVERQLGDVGAHPLAVSDAAAADPTGAPPGTKLVIALGRLRSPSRFVRASGLSLLEELSREPLTSFGKLAIGFAATHADTLGDALTPLEADRVAAAIRHVPDEQARDAALSRLAAAQAIAAATGEARHEAILRAEAAAPELGPLLARARALAAGGQTVQALPASSSRDKPTSDRLRAASLALDAVAALAAGRPRDAAVALHAAAELVERAASNALSPPVWVATRVALDAADANAREAALRLATASLSAAVVPPGGGFSGLARALERAGRADLARLAIRAAVAAKEPAAHEIYGVILRNEGWTLAMRGKREEAIAALAEAKEHLTAAAGPKPR